MTEKIGETLARKHIDNRARKSVVTESIIDRETTFLRKRLQDPSLDSRMVAKIIQNLSEKEIQDYIDYVERKATTHKGKAFVKLCSNVMKYRNIV